MNEWVLLTIGLLLTCSTGIFVAAEFSLVALDRSELERRRDSGEKRLDSVINALRVTSTHLSSAQLGITLTTLLAGYTLEPALSRLLTQPLRALGVSEGVWEVISMPIAVLIATVLSMIFGELVPKNFAISLPEATAKFVVPMQAAFTAVFRPAIFLLNGSANSMLRLLGVEPKEELSGARSAEELSSLVRHSASAGVLELDTATLLDKTLRFSELSAADAMTPRLKMQSIQKLDPVADVLAKAGSTGFSRFPIYDSDSDDIVGVAHVKQAIAVPREKRGEVPVAAIGEEISRVPETMALDSLLAELREAVYQCAIVVDEYGGTAGFVTLEDLVEELVGEVADEHDRAQAGVTGTAGKLLIPGELRPDELLEQTGITVPEDGSYDTVAGFMLHQLGRLPVIGDSVTLADGSVLAVERLEGRRIARIRYTGAALPERLRELSGLGAEPVTTATGTLQLPGHLLGGSAARQAGGQAGSKQQGARQPGSQTGGQQQAEREVSQ